MRINKLIMKPNNYDIPVKGSDGKLLRDESGKVKLQKFKVPVSRTKHWANTFNSLRAKGRKFPAPWKHNGSGPMDETSGTDILLDEPYHNGEGKSGRLSKENGGFWEKMWTDKAGNLWGQLDVPRKDDADKVGTVVTEVSPYIKKNFIDGKEEYEDCIMHVALVNHPVIPNQENFEPETIAASIPLSDDDDQYVSLSWATLSEELDDVTGPRTTGVNNLQSATNVSVAQVMQLLTKMDPPVILPDDTGEENFLERLSIALLQHGEKGDDPTVNKPEGSSEEPSPIALSIGGSKVEVPFKDDKISRSGLWSAFHSLFSQKKPTPELGVEKYPEIIQNNQADTSPGDAKMPLIQEKEIEQDTPAFKAVRKQYRTGVENRIKDMYKRGKVTAKYANANLEPMIETVSLSISDDGNIEETELDRRLNDIEQLVPGQAVHTGKELSKAQSTKKYKGEKADISLSTEMDLPEEYTEGTYVSEPNPDRVEEIVAAQIKASGR